MASRRDARIKALWIHTLSRSFTNLVNKEVFQNQKEVYMPRFRSLCLNKIHKTALKSLLWLFHAAKKWKRMISTQNSYRQYQVIWTTLLINQTLIGTTLTWTYSTMAREYPAQDSKAKINLFGKTKSQLTIREILLKTMCSSKAKKTKTCLNNLKRFDW